MEHLKFFTAESLFEHVHVVRGGMTASHDLSLSKIITLFGAFNADCCYDTAQKVC